VAEVAQAESNLLTRKVGPLPVWAYALIGLVLAWVYMKYRDSKNAATTAATDTTGTAAAGTNSSESQDTAPEFIIENNMPADNINVTTTSPGGGTPSKPVTPPTTPAPPVVTPPKTTPKPPVTTKPKPPAKTPTPAKKPPIQYRVHSGDTLSSIAAKYHTTWQKLWTFNTTAGNRPADTIATLKKRGPNLLYANELILIPQ
jgi:LysM repeat protein